MYEDTFDAPAAPAAGRAGTTLARKPPAAPAHTRKPALRIPGMPSDIYVPEAAMNPTIHAGGPAAGAGRDRR